MKMAVEFPSVAFREGPAKVREMATAIEEHQGDDFLTSRRNSPGQRVYVGK